MSVLLLVRKPQDVAPMIAWAGACADVEDRKLYVVVLDPKAPAQGERVSFLGETQIDEELGPLVRLAGKGLNRYQAERSEAVDGSSTDRLQVPLLWRLGSALAFEQMLKWIREWNVGLLCVHKQHEATDDDDLRLQLFRAAPCDLMLVRTAGNEPHFQRILVPVSTGPHARRALNWACKLADDHDGTVKALYVQRYDLEDANEIGQACLEKAVAQAGLHKHARLQRDVRQHKKVSQAIGTAAEECDVLMIGASDKMGLVQGLFGTVADHLLARQQGVTIVVFRRADPAHMRFWNRLSGLVKQVVPQQDREERVALSRQIGENSIAHFDFYALMFLATAIAGLGLMQNSTAVVVGAMLVAPLMTPIVGVGLGLVQGNAVQVRVAARSVAVGFGVAVAVGLGLGFLVPMPHLTTELAARGGPTLLDMGVAFLSGCAGAYAMGRSNLSAALPGVAIAAALVPPLATLGIALAKGYWYVAQGAFLLFGTNVVGIILGSSIILYLVGMRGKRKPGGAAWVTRMYLALVGLLIIFAIPLGVFMLGHLHVQSFDPQTTHEYKNKLQRADLPGDVARVEQRLEDGIYVVHLNVRQPLTTEELQEWSVFLREVLHASAEFEIRPAVVYRSKSTE